jgi:Na+/H+ antiporter NhaA
VVLVALGSLGIIAPVAVYFAMGDRAAQVLDGWKEWLSADNAVVMAVLFLVFGAVLVGKGIGGLS